MADETGAMKEKEGAKLLDIDDWCLSLNRHTLEKLMGAGAPAAFSAIGYVDPETGKHLIFVLAAGVEHGLTKLLVERAGHAVVAYHSVGDPGPPTPPVVN